jgi:hypothetical protein
VDHVVKTKAELLAILDDIRQCVQVDDSFEGSIEYLMPTDVDPNADFMVRAAYRVGNSQGQGGMCLIGSNDEPASAEKADDDAPRLDSNGELDGTWR